MIKFASQAVQGRMKCCFGLVLVSLLATGILSAQEQEPTFYDRLAKAALERTKSFVRYDPAYVVLKYPGGDVPPETGVCTDVVIRSYRALGIDLQALVHEDMRRNFSRYPKNWGLSRPDKNIDHRRVPNLQRYFKRQGAALPVSDDEADYKAGDLVAWDLNGRGLTHIGIVVPAPEGESGVWIVHNIGAGPKLEQRLFDWKVLGHYRFGEGVKQNFQPESSPKVN